MNKKELAKFLYDNFYDSETNTIDILGLDFSKYKCDIDISHMKVNGNLLQYFQTVNGSLVQSKQTVKEYLWQGEQKVDGDLVQDNQQVKGKIWQDVIKVIKNE